MHSCRTMSSIAKLWSLLLAFSACVWGVNVCPAPSPNPCTAVTRTHTAHFKCGITGVVKNPDPIEAGCQAPDFATCRDMCVFDPHCFTFSFDQTDVLAGFCTRYERSFPMQGFKESDKSTTKFWNVHCFKQSCPNLNCPSDNFQIQVSGSKFNLQYLVLENSLGAFTADATDASYYHLNEACNLVFNGDPELIANSMSPLPNPHAGPLYFNQEATVEMNGYLVPTCNFQQKTTSLSCKYDSDTGNETYACNNVLSLPGPYPGKSVCGKGNGDVSMEGVNFVKATSTASAVKRGWWN